MKDSNPTQPHTLKANVMERIVCGDVTPCPKYQFLLKNGAFVLAAFIAVLLGAVAVAVSIFTTFNAGWEYYEMTHENALTFAVAVLPYVWILVLGITLMLGYYNLRHTKRGYRYSMPVVMVSLVGTSVIGGVLLHHFQVGYMVDMETERMMSGQYRSALSWQQDMWHAPDKGRLFGVVASTSENSFTLLDINGTAWEIDTLALKQYDHKLMVGDANVRLVAVTDERTKQGTGCMVLHGIEKKPPTYEGVMERRKIFKDRMEEEMAMDITREEQEDRKVVYAMCRKLMERLLGRPQTAGGPAAALRPPLAPAP